MKERILTFDIARVLCAIWIVGIHHMNGLLSVEHKFYLKDTLTYEWSFYFTYGVLACFTFISGFFQSKVKIENWINTKSFYKKRALRFAIPLFITLITLYLGGWLTNLSQVFTSIIGLSQFCKEPYPRTVWYFSMIIFLYLITPLLVYAKEKKGINGISLLSILIYSFLITYNITFSLDTRLLLYYWFYIIPFIIPFENFKINLNQICIYVAILSTIIFQSGEFIFHFLIASIFIICILGVSKLITFLTSTNKKLIQFIDVLAYSSMFAYLFHRQIYIIFKRLFSPENTGISRALVPIILLTIFVFSYYTQKAYDKFLNKRS